MLEWIDPESWEAFREMRKKIKAPMTPYAEKLILKELIKLKQAGHDPQCCLDQSICNCWRDVFPLRDKGIVSAKANIDETRAYLDSQRMTPEQRDASNRARQAALGALRRVS
jgi:hypothetical protein